MTADIEPLRVRELGRIAIGCANGDVYVGAGGHPDVAEHGVAHRPAVAELIRALEEEEFLYCSCDEAGIRLQLAQRTGVAEEKIDAVADQVRCGLMSGVEKENTVV